MIAVDYVSVIAHVVAIWTIAAMTPGANVILTINSALSHPPRLAFGAVIGVSLAVMVWGLLGASGLLLILKTFPWLFSALKVAGGAYLLYLGISKIRAAWSFKDQPWAAGSHLSLTFFSLLRQAALTSMLNPKTGLFVVSLFSVAMPADMTLSLTFVTMLLMGIITFCWHLVLLFGFSRQGAQTLYRRATRQIDFFTGGLFTLFGLKVMSS